MNFPHSVIWRASPVGMIRGRVANVIERFACHRDDVWLANFERMGGFDVEGKLL